MCRFVKLSGLLIISTVLGVVTGCYATAPIKPAIASTLESADPKAVFQQFIVKFKPGSVTCDKVGLARFSEVADLRMEFIRPMSGNACVVLLWATNPEALIRQQIMLKRHPSVEWAEPDALMKTQ